MHLSEHMTLGEVTKTSTGMTNIPSRVNIENLKRVCFWLETLRARYNQRYVVSGVRGHGGSVVREYSKCREEAEEPIVITSGFRSPEVNRAVGGSSTSNHLTGCAVDIRVAGIEQALRYAVIMMDYADETRQDYDELLIERNKAGRYWLHFAVRPKENRRKTMIIQK